MKCVFVAETKIMHSTWTEPHICLQERVTQSMHTMTLNSASRPNGMNNEMKKVQTCV